MSSSGKMRREFGQRFAIWESTPEKNSKKYKHPAMFPVNLIKDHIISWSNQNDLILDPFAGSGTTAIAAEQTGRKWICIERNENYYKGACERISDEIFK